MITLLGITLYVSYCYMVSDLLDWVGDKILPFYVDGQNAVHDFLK